MNKVEVRCWRVHAPNKKDDLLITYPEDNQGHSPISCLNCGTVYAVTVVKEVYVGPPLKQKLGGMKCIGCGVSLCETQASYPDRYHDDNGSVCEYQRSELIPNDDDSIVVELPEIYS